MIIVNDEFGLGQITLGPRWTRAVRRDKNFL